MLGQSRRILLHFDKNFHPIYDALMRSKFLPNMTQLAALGQALEAFPDVELGLLFGSRARGVERPESDFDVAVMTAWGSLAPDLAQISGELGPVVGGEVDVVDIRKATFPMLNALVRDGIAIYETRPGIFAQWRSGAMTQLDLDRPYYERARDAFLSRLASGHG